MDLLIILAIFYIIASLVLAFDLNTYYVRQEIDFAQIPRGDVGYYQKRKSPIEKYHYFFPISLLINRIFLR